jgi:hypothetical protein
VCVVPLPHVQASGAPNGVYVMPLATFTPSTVTAVDGLFVMIGEQERKIRADPVGTGSAILRKVFGAL